jgi:hypothetical protein
MAQAKFTENDGWGLFRISKFQWAAHVLEQFTTDFLVELERRLLMQLDVVRKVLAKRRGIGVEDKAA